MKHIYFNNDDNQLYWIDGCESGPVVVGKGTKIGEMKASETEEDSGIWHVYVHMEDCPITDPADPEYWTEIIGDYNLQGEKGDTGEKGEKGDRGIGCCIIFNRTNYTEAQWSEYEIGYQEYATRTGDTWLKDTIKLNELFIVTGISTDGGKLHMLVYKASDTYPESGKEEYTKGENVFGLLVSHLVLNKGPKGDTGSVGPMGPQGPLGEQGPKGDPGAGSMEVISIPAVSINNRIKFKLPDEETMPEYGIYCSDFSLINNLAEETIFFNKFIFVDSDEDIILEHNIIVLNSEQKPIIVNPNSKIYFSIHKNPDNDIYVINYLNLYFHRVGFIDSESDVIIDGSLESLSMVESGNNILSYDRYTGEILNDKAVDVIYYENEKFAGMINPVIWTVEALDSSGSSTYDIGINISEDLALATPEGFGVVTEKYKDQFIFDVSTLSVNDKILYYSNSSNLIKEATITRIEKLEPQPSDFSRYCYLQLTNTDCFIANDVIVYLSIR